MLHLIDVGGGRSRTHALLLRLFLFDRHRRRDEGHLT
jgi:hypothetical protein